MRNERTHMFDKNMLNSHKNEQNVYKNHLGTVRVGAPNLTLILPLPLKGIR